MPALTGEEIAQQVTTIFTKRLAIEASALPAANRDALLAVGSKVVQSLVAAYVVLLTKHLYQQVNVSAPLREVCRAGVSAIGARRQADEALAAAALSFEAVSELLASMQKDVPRAGSLKAAFRLGHADVRMTQVMSGMWNIIAQADATSQVATQVQAARASGGLKRGEALKAAALEWKAHLLPLAIELDRRHPEWTRQQLATELLFQNKMEKSVGLKSVEDWLKAEVEQPNGPIRSRSQTKRAKQL